MRDYQELVHLVDGLTKGKAWAGLDYSGKQKREISADVALGPAKDGGTVTLELSIHHDKDDKRYVASLRIVTIEELENGFTSRKYNLSLGGDNRQMAYLDRVDSGRYSAKALEAFWELQVGKLKDDPYILGNLDLDYNQEERVPAVLAELEDEDQFYARDLIKALDAEGIHKAWVWQSGGGTATLYIKEEEGHNAMLAGPGSYNWTDHATSIFWLSDFSYGLDHDDWYESRDYETHGEPPSYDVKPGTSIPDIAKAIAEQYRKDNKVG